MTSLPEKKKHEQVKLVPAENLWTTARDGAVRLRMEKTGPASEPPITTIQMFQQTVQHFGNKPSLATKRDGRWESITYLQYYQQCRAAAKSFLKEEDDAEILKVLVDDQKRQRSREERVELGLERFHGVGILGCNSVEWLVADVGAIMAGGFAVGIYTTNSPDACKYIAENCEANILVVENPAQLTKILQIRDQLPHLKAIVQYRDELQEERPNVYTWKDFLELGNDIPESQLDKSIASLKVNQCCTLIYTSGTTGTPKGVMLSHDNITWVVKASGQRQKLTNNDVTVSYLPMSHVAAQIVDIWRPICFGYTTYFADPDALKGTLLSTLVEVRPTRFLGVPHVWEKILEKMKNVESKLSLMNSNDPTTRGYSRADNLVLKSVHKAVGLDRAAVCASGAAPISREILEYLKSFNICLMEDYGMSECSAPHTISLNDEFRLTSVGKELPGCKTRIYKPDDDGIGEICMWGRHIFMGYLNMEDKTKESLDEEGWLHSGDLGKFDEDGFLYITGRIKELIITMGGENIPPIPIENAVKKELPIISNAMLVGDKRKFLTMLLTLKCTVHPGNGEPRDDLTPEAIQVCQQLGSKATRVSEVIHSRDTTIYDAIQKGMERVNLKAISNAQKVQKWTILPKDFSITGGELGPTSKLRRPVVLAMYEEVIDEFYKAEKIQGVKHSANGAALAVKPLKKSQL